MEQRLYLIDLYDYYGKLLTKKQQDYFEDYYFENLTMEEISDNYNISKNAVSKSLIEVKRILEEYEKKLRLYHNKKSITSILSESDVKKISEFI